MKYVKKRQRYESGRFAYNPLTRHCTSYDWWDISRIIGGTLVINTYPYSPTTAQHIGKAWGALQYPGDAISISVHSHGGKLTNKDKVIKSLSDQIADLYEEARRPKTHKAKNLERIKRANELEVVRGRMLHLYELEELQATQGEIEALNALQKGE